jgi:hypothetical protein
LYGYNLFIDCVLLLGVRSDTTGQHDKHYGDAAQQQRQNQ